MNRIIRTLSLPVQLALRSQQIGLTFSRYGLGGALTSMGFEVGKRGLNWVGVGKSQARVNLDAVFGKNCAKTFAKLGPTFIKLGQILASRPDFIGEPVAEELKVLFDRVPPIPFREIKRILNREIGKDQVRRLLGEIESSPLASASISQTHRAKLADGTPVILKIQKTGVAETVRLDLVLLEMWVRPVHLLNPRLQLLQMFKDFRDATLREVDYRIEAQNIDRFRKNYRRLISQPDIVFPRYFPELTTEKVIALEPMHGRKLSDLKKGSTVARGAAGAALAAVLEQIFDHGFFHADPHAGNLFFLEDEGRLGFIDLGMVGQLDPEDKRKFLKVLLAVLQKDRDTLARSLFELGRPGKRTKFAEFEKGVQKLLDDVKASGVDSLRMDQLVNKLLVITRKNGIMIPNRYVLMIRSCLLIEGVAKSLDPKISIFKIATPIVAKSLMKSYNPFNFIKRWL